jgi:hypothetical protein
MNPFINEQERAKAFALQGFAILLEKYEVPVTCVKIDWDTGMIELNHEFEDNATQVQFALEAAEIMHKA